MTGTETYVKLRVPFVAQQSAVYVDEECAHPEHDKYVDEIVVTVLGTISEQSQGEGEEQAYEQWPPQVPIFKIIDATLPMFGQQQHYVAYLMSDGF